VIGDTVSVEGRPHGIAANGIVPAAVTPVVEELSAQDTDLLSDAFDPSPDLVSPVVAWLAHEDCNVTGELFPRGLRFGWDGSSPAKDPATRIPTSRSSPCVTTGTKSARPPPSQRSRPRMLASKRSCSPHQQRAANHTPAKSASSNTLHHGDATTS